MLTLAFVLLFYSLILIYYRKLRESQVATGVDTRYFEESILLLAVVGLVSILKDLLGLGAAPPKEDPEEHRRLYD